MNRPSVAARLDRFSQTWIANPAAKLEFAKLLERVIDVTDGDDERADEAQYNGARAWIASEKETAKRLGIK